MSFFGRAGAQATRVTNPLGESGDAFGHAVAVAGDRAIVGAWKEDIACPLNPACNSGGAHVYEFDETAGWRLAEHLFADDDGAGDNFGHAVAVAGDIAVIGSPGAGLGGAVYTFSRDETLGWIQQDRQSFSNEGAGDRYGFAVALEMPYLVVGSPGSDLRANGAGVVFVYRRHESGVWVQADLLVATDSEAGDNFGHAVGIRDGTIAVTAPGDDDAGVDTGSTYFFEPDVAGGWSSAGKISSAGTSDESDCAASAAAASTFGFTGKKGQVVTARRTAGGWEMGTPITPVVADSSFGCAVAYADNVLLVGAWRSSDFRKKAGSVTVYESDDSGSWVTSQFLWPDSLAADDEYGRRVATDGRWALVGAPGADVVADRAGAAYFYDLGEVLAVGRPTPETPADGSSEVTLAPLLTWSVVPDATYQLQVADNAAILNPTHDAPGLSVASYALAGLTVGSTYYWRVRAVTAEGEGPWSSVFSFTTTTTNVGTDELSAASKDGVQIMDVYPNPARSGQRIQIAFRGSSVGSQPGFPVVTVFDIAGRVVRNVHTDVNPGRGEVSVVTNRLPAGVYAIRIRVGSTTDTRLLFVR